MKKALYVATVDIHIKSFHLPYLKLLHDKGYEVHVATNGDERFPFCDVKHQICIERSPFKLSNLKAITQLKRIIETEKFDIIHCHTPMGSVVTRLAAKTARKKYGTRVIYTAHGFHFYKGAPKLNWFLFYPIEKYLAKYTDTLITINNEDYSLAKRKFSKKCNDIQYVPGVGIDIKKFDVDVEKIERSKLIKEFPLRKNDFILTCVARLDKNKHQDFLIDVMENNIHFLGRRDDIPNILAVSNVIVSASMREGLPVNVIEAFSASKPVVALNCRGMKDLIEDDINGFVVNNINDFIEKIDFLYGNPKKNIIICNNNKKKAKEFNVSHILEKIKKIYRL